MTSPPTNPITNPSQQPLPDSWAAAAFGPTNSQTRSCQFNAPSRASASPQREPQPTNAWSNFTGTTTHERTPPTTVQPQGYYPQSPEQQQQQSQYDQHGNYIKPQTFHSPDSQQHFYPQSTPMQQAPHAPTHSLNPASHPHNYNGTSWQPTGFGLWQQRPPLQYYQPEHSPPWIQSQFNAYDHDLHNPGNYDRDVPMPQQQPPTADTTAFNGGGPQFTTGVTIDRTFSSEFSPSNSAGPCHAPYAAGPAFASLAHSGLFSPFGNPRPTHSAPAAHTFAPPAIPSAGWFGPQPAVNNQPSFRDFTPGPNPQQRGSSSSFPD